MLLLVLCIRNLYVCSLSGLSLVVEKSLRLRKLRILRTGLLNILLLKQLRNHRIHSDITLLRVHVPHGAHFLAVDGNHWIFRGVLVH